MIVIRSYHCPFWLMKQQLIKLSHTLKKFGSFSQDMRRDLFRVCRTELFNTATRFFSRVAAFLRKDKCLGEPGNYPLRLSFSFATPLNPVLE